MPDADTAANADTRTLGDLMAYNAWANAKLFALVTTTDAARLDADAPGTRGTLTDTLKHLVGVEDAYHTMLSGGPMDQRLPFDDYMAQPLSWFAARLAELATAYADLLARADAAFLDAPLRIPWFDFAVTKRDGFLQVAQHSAQHRAQVLSVLGQRGLDVPDVDYVLWVEDQGGR